MSKLSCSACEDLLVQQRVEDLPAEQAAAIHYHLQTCPACSAYMQTLQHLSKALSGEKKYPPNQIHRQLRARMQSPLTGLLKTRVPLYQVALGTAAALLLFVVEAPDPQRGADTMRASISAVTAIADTYEVSANLRLLDTSRRGLDHSKDSLMIHFPTRVNSI